MREVRSKPPITRGAQAKAGRALVGMMKKEGEHGGGPVKLGSGAFISSSIGSIQQDAGESAERPVSCSEGGDPSQLTWLSIFSSTKEVLYGRASTRRRIPAPEMKLDSTFSVFNTLFSFSISARALSHKRKARVPVSHPEQGWSPSWVEPKIMREPC